MTDSTYHIRRQRIARYGTVFVHEAVQRAHAAGTLVVVVAPDENAALERAREAAPSPGGNADWFFHVERVELANGGDRG